MWSLRWKARVSIPAGALLLAAYAPQLGAQCQRAKLSAADGQGGDRFGRSVALSASVAVVGAPFNDGAGYNYGAAYVFEESSAVWSAVDKLVPSDDGGLVGWSVATDGDVIVVGAKNAWTTVFERTESAWLQVAELIPEDYEPGDGSLFGSAVAISADFALVGAPYDDAAAYESGSAYVFERDPYGVWSQAAKLLAQDGDAGDHFGDAVAVNGDAAVIGAQDDDDLGNWSGSAYVFERNPDRTWSQVTKLLPHDGGPMWNFGTSVAVSGDVALIGANGAWGAADWSGAAYVFERQPDGTWPEVAKLSAVDGATGDAFGTSLGLSANVAVIGAYGDQEHGGASGSAYVFVREPDDSWPQAGKVSADDGAPFDWFGKRVAVSGNIAVIGAYQDDDHGEDSGSAYVFAVGPDDDGDGVMDVCEGLGDLNCDDLVNGFDIDPFVLALTSAPEFDEYYAAYPDCDHTRADCNEDGSIDGFDIDPFVELLTGG